MGLDQWIFKKTDGEITIDDESVCYWRKCNQIHKYFDTLCDGVENCGKYTVTLQDLKHLKNLCEQVLKARNAKTSRKLLPHTRGSFFGAYEYDKFYYMELEHTIKQIDEVIASDEGDEYYYLSWW